MKKFHPLWNIARTMGKLDCLFAWVMCFVICMANALPALADRGPCATFIPSVYSGSIGCDTSGSCIGLKYYAPSYLTCSNADENACSHTTQVKATLTSPKTVVDNSWSTWLACVGGNVACGTCVAGAVGVSIISAGSLAMITGGVCSMFCGVVGNIDPCCRVTCEEVDSPGPIHGFACP